MRTVTMDAPGLALTVNHRHQLKLVDIREGFQQIFPALVEIRGSEVR